MDQDPRPSAQDPTRPHGPENHNPRSSEHPDVRRTWAELQESPGAAWRDPEPRTLDGMAASLYGLAEADLLAPAPMTGMLGLQPAGAIVDETSRLASRDHARTRATRGRTPS